MRVVTTSGTERRRQRIGSWQGIGLTGLLTVAFAAAGLVGWASHSIDKTPAIADRITRIDGALQFVALARVSDAACAPMTMAPRIGAVPTSVATRCEATLTAAAAVLHDGIWPYDAEHAAATLGGKVDRFTAFMEGRRTPVSASAPSERLHAPLDAPFQRRPWVDVHKASAILRAVLGISSSALGDDHLELL